MSYFDVFGSIFEKSAMTDLPKVIVSICLVSYNICMIPHVCRLTFGLNLSGAWGGQQEGGTLLDMLPNPRYITLMGHLLSLIFISSDVQTILNDLYCCVIVIL